MSTSNLFEWTSLLGGSNWDRGSALTTGSDGSIYITGDSSSDFDGQNGSHTDAFISKFSPDGTKEWTRFLGGFWGDVGKALATGIDGSIYISGHTQNHLDGVSSFNGGSSDAFLSKFNSDGSKDWTRLYGGSWRDSGNALTVGSDGSIYIAGETQGSLEYPSGKYTFISKYSSDGIETWTRTFANTFQEKINANNYATALTTGNNGSIYIAGYTQDDLDDQISNGGDAFISKFTPDGEKLWTRFLGSSSGDIGNALITGSDGSIYIAGETYGNLDGHINYDGPYTADAFISKFTSDGEKLWTRTLGSSSYISGRTDGDLNGGGSSYGRALTTGLDGSIYLTGETTSDLYGQFNSVSGTDIFISKFSPDGTKGWTRIFGTSATDHGTALTTGTDGSIYIAGFTDGDLNGQINNGGSADAFISKLSFSSDGFSLIGTSPTVITLSARSLNENIDAGSTVANLFTSDTYELVNSCWY